MRTPIVTELPRVLEPVEPDTFIEHAPSGCAPVGVARIVRRAERPRVRCAGGRGVVDRSLSSQEDRT
jgi:hypothetical protein